MTQSTRKTFEAQAEKDGYRLELGPDGMAYLSGHTQVAWEWWQAATEAAKATSVAMGELPPLPEPDLTTLGNRQFFTPDQMRKYGQQCAEIAKLDMRMVLREATECAAEWKAKAEAARQPAPVVEQRKLPELPNTTLSTEVAGYKIPVFGAQHMRDYAIAALAATAAPVAATQHPDDIAVDKFAVAMKDKMAESRAKGRGGWDDEGQCDMELLANMLVAHVAKGDPVDIGNFAMMLHQREVMAMEHHPCYAGAASSAIKFCAAQAATPSPSLAVRDVALEQAAAICDAIGQDHRDQYKGRGKYEPTNPRRADPHADGCSDGANECSDAIRALKGKPNADCSGEPANCPDNEGFGCACDPMNKAAGEAKNG